MEKIQFVRTKDVKIPERGTSKSAGLDFFVPNDFKDVWLEPQQSIVIDMGIHLLLPKNKALVAMNKSGVAVKKGIVVGACVIDEDYQGELKVHLINTSKIPVIISPSEKIVQFLLLDVSYAETEEKETNEQLYQNQQSERKQGGFGSTNKAIKPIPHKNEKWEINYVNTNIVGKQTDIVLVLDIERDESIQQNIYTCVPINHIDVATPVYLLLENFIRKLNGVPQPINK